MISFRRCSKTLAVAVAVALLTLLSGVRVARQAIRSPQQTAARFLQSPPIRRRSIRYGPQQGNGADQELPKDTLVTLIRPSFGYCKVQLLQGSLEGYVASEDIRPAPPTLLAALNPATQTRASRPAAKISTSTPANRRRRKRCRILICRRPRPSRRRFRCRNGAAARCCSTAFAHVADVNPSLLRRPRAGRRLSLFRQADRERLRRDRLGAESPRRPRRTPGERRVRGTRRAFSKRSRRANCARTSRIKLTTPLAEPPVARGFEIRHG